MQLGKIDYVTLAVAYMFTTLNGDDVMSFLKMDKITKMIPGNAKVASALVHALFFIAVVVGINAIAAKIASEKGAKYSCGSKK